MIHQRFATLRTAHLQYFLTVNEVKGLFAASVATFVFLANVYEISFVKLLKFMWHQSTFRRRLGRFVRSALFRGLSQN